MKLNAFLFFMLFFFHCQKNVVKSGKNEQQYFKNFNSEKVATEKYLKTKTKSDVGKINTDFYGKEMLKGSHYIFLTSILIDSVFRYYPQVFLEECKYIAKEKKLQ